MRLTKGRVSMLAFFDFPAEYWDHLRTSTPDRERVRHRPSSNRADEGTLSAMNAELIVFKVVVRPQKPW